MQEHIPFLRGTQLFCGLKDDEILSLLEHLDTQLKCYQKSEMIWDPSSEMPFLGILVEGGLMILQEDWRGNRYILGDYGPGDFLGESVIVQKGDSLPYFLSVREKTACLLLDYKKLMTPSGDRSEQHLIFLRNLVEALVRKELCLLSRIEYLCKRSTRDKIIAYLSLQSARAGSRKFNLPYTRQELADFLAVDRSAMCTELTRMQADGLIRYDRRCFELL